MKLANLITIAFMAGTISAVYPPVTADSSIAENDLVTIQGEKEKLSSYIKSQETQSSIDSTKSSTLDKSDSSDEKSTNAFFLSTSMIIVSEIGDKTFLVAALMAMKHPRATVFSAGFSALVIMTILSGVVGHALPSLLPQRLTQLMAAILFVVFGFNLLKEGLQMSKDAGVEGEMAEVEEEIEFSTINNRGRSIEEGSVPGTNNKSSPFLKESLNKLSNLAAFVLSPVWAQTFAMTFLGEWGDRSQIATIAMAAGSDYWLVILGGIVGHGFCTGLAVIGGQLLATKISMRTVTLGGAAAFFLFSIMYFYSAMYNLD
ncbi:hypothetical protein CANARDRAFT_193271 [[Candida] arabinofermentans NRRL YB-2248]|uniref:GDT1 family protein n=1 Tax=[Candida] arabinofermentans NRRL YB-2248 TaxID=983967 RepID=A0A1E4T7Q0_9ASCO|nr:hypothetical protein CANARDRAFT_193271 [[Candida] arabinofermentans NRRL YB-2248]